MADAHGEPARPSAASAPSASTTSAASVLAQALQWTDAGAGVVLATVVKAWSTAPRRAGTQMAVRDDGTRSGTLFGDSVDAVVAARAREVLATGVHATLDLTVDDATASTAGMACGGGLEVRLECISGTHGAGQVEVLRQALDALAQRRSVVLCTGLSSGRHALLDADDTGTGPWAAEARKRARMDDTAIVAMDDESVLFQVFNAPLRLYVIGAVRTALSLWQAARLLGFDVTIVEPRPDMAGTPSFEEARLQLGEVAALLREARLDGRCAVVALAHAPEIDDPALVEAVRSKAFYIGALGSRKSHAARLERLGRAGIPPELAARIHGPAGLDIGAIGPAKIAASIVAEMVTALRKAPLG